MRFPAFGLFSRLLALFSVTLILIGLNLFAAFMVISEEEVIEQLKQRQETIIARFASLNETTLTQQQLAQHAEEIKGDILIESTAYRLTTDPQFPTIANLLKSATKVGRLYYAKKGIDYYLLYPFENGYVAVTSRPFSLMVYQKPYVYWPWLFIVIILLTSYLVLKRWLQPVLNSVHAVRHISQGDFTQHITSHPNNELADLTRGINRMAQEIKKIVDSKNELLLAVSHELRTPLARMQVSLAMLPASQYSDEIANDLQQMNILIEQLLEGERLEAGYKALHITKQYLPMLVDELMSEGELNSTVTLCDAVPDVVVNLDAGRFKFLLRNLLNNAIQHTPDSGSVSLHIETIKDRLLLTITDTGTGIPQHLIPRLFEPFYRLNGSEHRDVKGAGLGLYLCKRIAEAHGGDISATSTPGKGSCFSVSLPVVPD